MSKQLAIATVTAAIQRILDAPLGAEVGGAAATAARPRTEGDLESNPGISIFLYGVQPHTAHGPTGEDLPTRRSNGQLVQRPRVALQLSYLLIAYGDAGDHHPERLLGVAAREMHSHPIIDRELIAEIRAAADPPSPTIPIHDHLATTDLDDEIELVKLSLLPLDSDEMSKLWSAFQAPYSLSLAYHASVVFIDADVTATRALPVLTRGVYTVPLRTPAIETVEASTGAGEPIFATSTIVLRGRNLRGDVTLVRVSGEELTPATAHDTRVTLALSGVASTSLQPGLQTARIVQQRLMGEPPVPHAGVSSNQTTFTLSPTVTAVALQDVTASGTAFDGTVVIDVDLAVDADQQVVLRLSDATTETVAQRTIAPDRTTASTTLTIPFAGVPAGTYLVQLEVDGAASQIERDAAGVATGPTVVLS